MTKHHKPAGRLGIFRDVPRSANQTQKEPRTSTAKKADQKAVSAFYADIQYEAKRVLKEIREGKTSLAAYEAKAKYTEEDEEDEDSQMSLR